MFSSWQFDVINQWKISIFIKKMNYYQPAIRLLPTCSLLVQKLNSASYDGGLTAKWTAGNFFSNSLPSKNRISTSYKRIANYPIQPEPAMCPASYASEACPPRWHASSWLFNHLKLCWILYVKEPVDIYWFPNTGIDFNQKFAHHNMGWWPSEVIVGISWKNT